MATPASTRWPGSTEIITLTIVLDEHTIWEHLDREPRRRTRPRFARGTARRPWSAPGSDVCVAPSDQAQGQRHTAPAHRSRPATGSLLRRGVWMPRIRWPWSVRATMLCVNPGQPSPVGFGGASDPLGSLDVGWAAVVPTSPCGSLAGRPTLSLAATARNRDPAWLPTPHPATFDLESGPGATLPKVDSHKEGWCPGVVRTLSVKQEALTKARTRRLVLDADRDARDRRVVAAAAEVFVQLAERAQAEHAVIAANSAIGAALRCVLAEGVGIDGVARLVDMDPAEVRRLVKFAASVESDGVGDAREVASGASPVSS